MNDSILLSKPSQTFGIVAYGNSSYTLLESGAFEDLQQDLDILKSIAPQGIEVAIADISGLDTSKLLSDAMFANQMLETCVYC